MNDKKFVKQALKYYEWCVGAGFSTAKQKYPNILIGFTGQSYSYNLFEVKKTVDETIKDIKNSLKHQTNSDPLLSYQLEIIDSMLNYIASLTPEQVMNEAIYWNSNRFGLYNPTAKDDVKKRLIKAISDPRHKY